MEKKNNYLVTKEDIDKKIDDILYLTRTGVNRHRNQIILITVGAAALISVGFLLGRRKTDH